MVTVSNVSLTFGGQKLFAGADLKFMPGNCYGVIGANGAGKSTFLRILSGDLEPTSGEVIIDKRTRMSVLKQDHYAYDDQTVLDTIIQGNPRLFEIMQQKDALYAKEDFTDEDGELAAQLEGEFAEMNGWEAETEAGQILSGLGLSDSLLYDVMGTLGDKQKVKILLARALFGHPDIILLDEPTNHLDIETLGWLERFLADYDGCVMVVSHDRYFLDRVTNKTLCIQNHRAKLYNGGYTKSMEQRRIDREIQEKHYKDQQKEIARQEAYIAQQRAWNRERNIIAAESRQKMLDKMVRVERPDNAPKPIKLKFTASRPSGNDVLDLRDVSMGFDGRMLFEHLNFLVKKDDRLLVLGQNGCGKSTLIKLIIGKLEPVSGIIEAGYNVEIGYYDQENQNLDPANTVLDELWNTYPRMTETEIRNTLGQFRFVGEDVYKEVSVLSGGERARLTLAKLILSKMNLLVLDEPTNHLDIDSREALEAALEGFDGTIFAVSHDRYFIEKLATRIVEITPGQGATLVNGQSGGDFTDYRVEHKGEAYTEYRTFMEARRSGVTARPTVMGGYTHETPANDTPTASKEAYQQAKATAAEARKKKNRIDKLHKEAERLEAEIEAIDEELNGSAASNYVRAAELDTRKGECEEELMAVYEELEELGE